MASCTSVDPPGVIYRDPRFPLPRSSRDYPLGLPHRIHATDSSFEESLPPGRWPIQGVNGIEIGIGGSSPDERVSCVPLLLRSELLRGGLPWLRIVIRNTISGITDGDNAWAGTCRSPLLRVNYLFRVFVIAIVRLTDFIVAPLRLVINSFRIRGRIFCYVIVVCCPFLIDQCENHRMRM